MNKKIIVVLTIALLIFGLMSCSSGNPYEGIWCDNEGNYIQLNNNKSFLAKINGTDYSGSYVQNLNTMALAFNGGKTLVVEWDLRDSVLYLCWIDENGDDKELQLYYFGKATK